MADNKEFDIVVHKNEIEAAIYDICQELEIDDLKSESQRPWKAVLQLVGERLYKGTGILKQQNNVYNSCMSTNCNSYDYDKLMELCDYYLLLSNKYKKLPSVIGFSLLSGVEDRTIEGWKDKDLNSKSFLIWKKLQVNREDCLKDKLFDSNNPVGSISIGNTEMGWAMPGVRNDGPRREQIAADEAKSRFEKFMIDQKNSETD